MAFETMNNLAHGSRVAALRGAPTDRDHSAAKRADRPLRIGLFMFLIASVSCPMVLAQEAGQDQPKRAADEQREVIVVFAGQSKLIKAPWPVERISVTDPKVADIEAITPDGIMIVGRKIGTTDVVLWNESEEVWQARVDINIDLDRFQKELDELFPGSEIKVAQSQDVVVATGTLASHHQVNQLDKFLKASEQATGQKYVDMTMVAALGTGGTGGVATGVTTAALASGNASNEVRRIDPARLQGELNQLFSGSTLLVRDSEGVFVISGKLRLVEQARQMEEYLAALQASSIESAQSAARSDKSGGSSFGSGFRFVNMTSVAGVQQVMLQVRLAEASRTAIRALGINVLQAGHNDNTFFGASMVGPDGGGAMNPINIGPAAGVLAGNENVPFTFNSSVNVSPLTSLLLGFPRAELEFFVQALAENQYMRILAEPNLVALSGEEASFLAGGEFPIPVVQGGNAQGGVSISIEYKEFGVRLKFRPTVLGDNRIRLHLAPEVSELSDQGAVEIQGFRVPSLITRRAETTLELRSGQTFAMAGLLSRSNQGRNSRVPGLGDVPVLGALFRSSRYVEGKTELLVLVTASLVEPSSLGSTPPMPGILHQPPNDWEFYGMGQIEGNTPPELSPAEADWLHEIGLNDLKGPGAWARYEQGPAKSEAPLYSPVTATSLESEEQ